MSGGWLGVKGAGIVEAIDDDEMTVDEDLERIGEGSGKPRSHSGKIVETAEGARSELFRHWSMPRGGVGRTCSQTVGWFSPTGEY